MHCAPYRGWQPGAGAVTTLLPNVTGVTLIACHISEEPTLGSTATPVAVVSGVLAEITSIKKMIVSVGPMPAVLASGGLASGG